MRREEKETLRAACMKRIHHADAHEVWERAGKFQYVVAWRYTKEMPRPVGIAVADVRKFRQGKTWMSVVYLERETMSILSDLGLSLLSGLEGLASVAEDSGPSATTPAV